MSPCVIAIILIPKKYIDVESASKMKSKSLVAVDKYLDKVIQNTTEVTKSVIGKMQAHESEIVKGMEMGFSKDEATYEMFDNSPPRSGSLEEIPSDKMVRQYEFQTFLAKMIDRFTVEVLQKQSNIDKFTPEE